MWSWFESVWVQVTLGSCFSFLYRFLRIMRIVDLFCWTTIRLQVGQVLAGCMLGRLDRSGPV